MMIAAALAIIAKRNTSLGWQRIVSIVPMDTKIVTFDATTCVEDENHQTFTFRIEVRMRRNVRFPIGGCLIRCFTVLHVFGCGTFPQ